MRREDEQQMSKGAGSETEEQKVRKEAVWSRHGT
jgi:hypothetical protein